MRVVYDDAMQNKFCEKLYDVMFNLKHNIKSVVKYDYGKERVQKHMVRERLNCVLEDYDMEIGNTVKHAHGIGNNSEYPVYYHAGNEIQHCANIHINSGLHGEVYVYATDYNGNRISMSYELTKHGVVATRR